MPISWNCYSIELIVTHVCYSCMQESIPVTVLALGSVSEQTYFTLSSYICANKNNKTP